MDDRDKDKERDTVNPKRRRGLGIVTPNACTECRKKRAKCDGETPCARCASQKNVECVYEVPVRQSKENMRSEIEHLKAYQQQSERVLAAIASQDQTAQVIDRLRQGEGLKSIADNLQTPSQVSSAEGGNITTYTSFTDHQAIGNALRPVRGIIMAPFTSWGRSGLQGPTADFQQGEMQGMWNQWPDTHNISSGIAASDDLMNWQTEPANLPENHDHPAIGGTWPEEASNHSTPNSTVLYARGQGQETILGQGIGSLREDSPTVPPASWTKVTSDSEFVDHLMALYFCWEYPTFASLSKEHFLHDYKTGKTEHCSELLVNAILALGCRFSANVNARTDPHDSGTAGGHFFAEATRLLKLEKDQHSLTTIQALGLMAIREASGGRSSASIYLSGQSLRLAIEMGLHLEAEGQLPSQPVEGSQAVRLATFWGAFSLDQAWSLTIGRVPLFSHITQLNVKPAIVSSIEASAWIPYTDDGAPLERNCTQPSNIRSVYATFCELSELVHQSLYLFYAPGSNVNSNSLLKLYTKFLRWYDSIPAALRLGHNFTPSVLFSHMYYHYTILLLFRPFIKLSLIGSEVSPRDVCNQAADAISALTSSYAQLYTLRRTPSFVPHFILASSITHLVTLGNAKTGVEKVTQGIADLREMASCHGFAARACNILRHLAKKWNIEVPDDSQEPIEPDVFDAQARPSPNSLNQFCTQVDEADMMRGIGLAGEEENPLFWPFPMQGRPLMQYAGGNLGKLGFERLKK
ncbi:uncharacterized protein EAE97_000791 [Botrytis byssoidea]|uniref:Zn(2)-C6 fungal-type domain-containing protein n=1 Tax=Botrytis byssoidea TaxID=139641 RepID=A0A9P5M5W6_9HELO|nr:uncharacterized protein EAE97_000791 [Botrytis byssoidea]KAF7953392.1 hypothetical protein EAE97_000791 [Botrytis byssoidea]